MPQAKLVKKLIESHQQRDNETFLHAAQEVIEDERRRRHTGVAKQLEEALRAAPGDDAMPRGDRGPAARSAEISGAQRGLFEVREPQRQLNELVLEPVITGLVERLIRDFRQWERLAAAGIPPIGLVLFCGPSGCGKTATAEALATELSVPLLQVRFDTVVSSLLGETSANLRAIMDFARQGRYVILFDEFDAIARSRADRSEHGEIRRVLNAFLSVVDNFGGNSLIIASTNFEQGLDSAVWRRFHEIVRFERPSEARLALLIRKRLASLEPDDSLLQDLVRNLFGCSHADVERVCFDVRKSCLLRNSQTIGTQDVREAIAKRVYRQSILQRVSQGGAGPGEQS